METKLKKQSMGRQKIEIKKIEKKTNLQVTFSKRRTGLFKKVAELSTLSGANAAVLVESPGGKIFACGNPSPEHVIKRYLGLTNVDHNCYQENKVDEEAVEKLEKKGENDESELFWWRKNVDDLGLEELQEFKKGLEGLKRNVMARIDEMNLEMIMEIPRLAEDDFLGFC